MSDNLPDFVREEKLPDFVREEKAPAPHAAMGGNETMLHRFLQKFVPGSGEVVDQALAQGRADESAGFRPSFSINHGRTDLGQAGVTPTAEQAGAAAAAMPEKLAEVKAAAAQGGVENPVRAGLGNAMGEAAGLMAIPGIGKALGTIGPATEALSPAIGKFGAYILTRALAGMGVGAGAAAYKGQNPESGVLPGALMTISPGVAGAYRAASALAPGLSKEERYTRLFEGAPMMAAGASSTAAEMAPKLRQLAEENTVRAQGQKMKDIRRAGGVEGARSVGRTLLDEGLVPWLGTARDIGNAARQRAGEVGQSIGAGLDKIGAALPPELQARMNPGSISLKVANDVIPGLKSTWAQNGQVPAAENVVQTIAENGGSKAPLSFTELNRQKTAMGDRAYRAANPLNPSPDAEMLQGVYRSLNNHMENVGGSVAEGAGPQAFAKWLQDKQRYGNLEKASQTGLDASARELANRRVSPSDYLAGGAELASGGGGVKAAVAAAANKALRERGPAFAARGFDALAKLGGKAPNVFGGAGETPPTAPQGPMTPAAPLPPVEPFPGMMLTRQRPVPPGLLSNPAARAFAAEPVDYMPGNDAFNNATLAKNNLDIRALERNQPYHDPENTLLHPGTNEVVLPATGKTHLLDSTKLKNKALLKAGDLSPGPNTNAGGLPVDPAALTEPAHLEDTTGKPAYREWDHHTFPTMWDSILRSRL